MKIRILPLLLCFSLINLSAGGKTEPEEVTPEQPVSVADENKEEPGNSVREIPQGGVELSGLAGLGFEFPQELFAAQDVPLRPLDGSDAVMLSDFRGKVVLLNFWATWCPPCQKEMPSMERLNNFLEGKDFAMIAVDVDEDTAKVQKFIDDNGYTFPIYLDQNNEVYPFYGTGSIPTSYIIDKKGNVAARIIGSIEWDEDPIKNDLLKLIAE